MDILWAAMAICAIVSVVFYVLAISWQRTLRNQAAAIRTLVQRLEAFESMEDPVMRRKISELMPSPLEEVSILSFRLSDGFWRNTAGLTEAQIRHIHEQGTFVGSVKIETWRSHVTVTLRELPPHTQSSGWQTRTVDIYETGSDAGTVLWELDLEPALTLSTRRHATLELRYENKTVVLAMRHAMKQARTEIAKGENPEERIVFRIPLKTEQLVEFRMPETDRGTGTEGGKEEDTSVGSFAFQDEQQGVDWQLRLRSFERRISSGHWTIVEPRRTRRVS